MGEFNYSHIDWVDHISGQDAETKFLNTINDCFLDQLVLDPTKRGAVPDLDLRSVQGLGQTAAVPLCNSDSNVTRFDIHAGEGKRTKTKK